MIVPERDTNTEYPSRQWIDVLVSRRERDEVPFVLFCAEPLVIFGSAVELGIICQPLLKQLQVILMGPPILK